MNSVQSSPSKHSATPESVFRLKLERARQKTSINAIRRQSSPEYELRGNNKKIQDVASLGTTSFLLVGAAGTGKTLAILLLFNRLAWEYPGSRWLIARKVGADLAQTTLVTFERDVLGENNPICKSVQRAYRRSYKYPNGTEIVVGGMDRADRILSGDYDGIYAAEATEFAKDDIQAFNSRLRTGVAPYDLLAMDTNPGPPDHWLKRMADDGDLLLLNTYHKDNPRFWDIETNDWTEAGRRYVLGKLAKLTGVWRDRYFLGLWTMSEGAIYKEWRDDAHVVDWFPPPSHWRKFISIDFGYVHPFVCGWWAEDEDGRIYLYREIYWSERIVQDHADDIRRLTATKHWDTSRGLSDAEIIDYPTRDEWEQMSKLQKDRAETMGEYITANISDHDAEDRATLKRNGIRTKAAYKSVLDGIQMVQERLRIQEDGRPRLFVMRGATVEKDERLREAGRPNTTQSEFPAYTWSDRTRREEPLKENDDGMDMTRYIVAHLDRRGDKRPAGRRRSLA